MVSRHSYMEVPVQRGVHDGPLLGPESLNLLSWLPTYQQNEPSIQARGSVCMRLPIYHHPIAIVMDHDSELYKHARGTSPCKPSIQVTALHNLTASPDVSGAASGKRDQLVGAAGVSTCHTACHYMRQSQRNTPVAVRVNSLMYGSWGCS